MQHFVGVIIIFIKANQDDEATPGLHQGVEDDGVSMGMPARSPLDSLVGGRPW